MPNRVLREGILTSERVNVLAAETEVFYRRLMSAVDDFGRYTAHPGLLRAALYPLQLDRIREASMDRHLAECEKASLVRLYESSGKRFLELLRFEQHVRAKRSKWPAPDSICNGDAVHVRCNGSAHALGDGDGDGDDSPKPPAPAVAGRERDKPSKPTTAEALSICAIYHRRPETEWSALEVKAFRAAKPTLEDIALVAEYTAAEKAKGQDGRHRRDLKTLLNNWPGEVDRARAWKEKPANGRNGGFAP